jgi:hypothetical protein
VAKIPKWAKIIAGASLGVGVLSGVSAAAWSPGLGDPNKPGRTNGGDDPAAVYANMTREQQWQAARHLRDQSNDKSNSIICENPDGNVSVIFVERLDPSKPLTPPGDVQCVRTEQ